MFLSRASYERIIQERDEARDELRRVVSPVTPAVDARLWARVHAAERRVQELTLLVGMKGYAVEMTAEVPAVPAALVLTKIIK